MNTQEIMIKSLENAKGLPLPTYATADSAGVDLISAISEGESIVLKPMERVLVPTGIAICLPQGFEAQVRPRSGLSIKNGITVINAPGTIDADYRGEIKVPLVNLGTEDFVITRGLRVAQMVIAKYTRASWNMVEELPSSARGEGGFGSTGVKTESTAA